MACDRTQGCGTIAKVFWNEDITKLLDTTRARRAIGELIVIVSGRHLGMTDDTKECTENWSKRKTLRGRRKVHQTGQNNAKNEKSTSRSVDAQRARHRGCLSQGIIPLSSVIDPLIVYVHLGEGTSATKYRRESPEGQGFDRHYRVLTLNGIPREAQSSGT